MKRSDCHFKNLIRTSTKVSNSNIIVKNSLVDQSVSDELIELRNEGHQRRMGGLKQNLSLIISFFQNHEPGHIITLERPN
jgi:hypothetical protein